MSLVHVFAKMKCTSTYPIHLPAILYCIKTIQDQFLAYHKTWVLLSKASAWPLQKERGRWTSVLSNLLEPLHILATNTKPNKVARRKIAKNEEKRPNSFLGGAQLPWFKWCKALRDGLSLTLIS